MNKRKIDVNQIKKGIVRGKKYRNIDVKYEVVLSYFKQKQVKQTQIFQVTFFPLIQDLMTQLLTAELIYKLEEQNKQALKSINIGQTDQTLKLETFFLKGLSKEYPIQQICQCLCLEKNKKQIKKNEYQGENDGKMLVISKNKLMTFFKKLRLIYTDFCYCVGEKCILQATQLRNFYEVFKNQWTKRQQKGRLCQKGKLQKRLCRSLFFLGVLIENNIYQAIENAERKKRQQTDDLGTKSQKKKNIKGITQNQSSTYSFGSVDIVSNFSLRLKSQKSNEDDYFLNDYYHKNPYSQYSEKSQRIISKSKFGLHNKVFIQNLEFKIKRQPKQIQDDENTRFEINYLSNDVENILIEQAFKIQKFKDSCERNEVYQSSNPYYYMNYMGYYPTQATYDYGQGWHSQGSFGVGGNYSNNNNGGGYNNNGSYNYNNFMANNNNSTINPILNSNNNQVSNNEVSADNNNNNNYNSYNNNTDQLAYQNNNIAYSVQQNSPNYILTNVGNNNNLNYHNGYFEFSNSNLNANNNINSSNYYLSNNVIYEEGDQVNQMRRSFDFYNLVETRKNPHRFTAKKNK